MFKKNNVKAFTLVELLVVIAIIGIIASISIISLSNARAKAMDAVRVADLKQIKTALEMFFNDIGRYPTMVEWDTGSLYSVSNIGTTTYMEVIPQSPVKNSGDCISTNYRYRPIRDGNDYVIDFCLAKGSGDYLAGYGQIYSDAFINQGFVERNPEKLSTAQNDSDGFILDGPFGVAVDKGYAYVISFYSNALEIIDISNPDLMQHVATLHDGDGGALLLNPVDIVIDGDYAYLATRDTTGSLEIVDISNPTNPAHISGISHGVGGVSLNVPAQIYKNGDYIYINNWTGSSLEIIDVSDPFNPFHVSTVFHNGVDIFMDTSKDVAIVGNYAYVLGATSDSLQILDISNPYNPVPVGHILDGEGDAFLDGPFSIEVIGKYAYIANYYDYFEVIDVSDPANPVHVSKLHDGWLFGPSLDAPNKLKIVGSYAFIASEFSEALEVLDISDPFNPTHAAKYIFSGNQNRPRSLFAEGNYVYFANFVGDNLNIIKVFSK